MSFEYHEPDSLAEVTALLVEHGDDVMPLGGGTTFTVLLKMGLLAQGHVVGLRRVPDLVGIRTESEGLWIGASSRHSEVEHSAVVREDHATLADTYRAVATVRIRNQATVGGGVAFGDPAQDPPVTLMALDAAVVTAGPNGSRQIAMDDFFVDYFTTALEPGEVIVGVSVPPSAGMRSTFKKYLPRSVDDYATVAVAAAARLDAAGCIADLRVALGGVGPTPIRARAVEDALRGTTPDPTRLGEAAALVGDEIRPMDDVRGSAEYKREMSRVFVRRALATVTLDGSVL